MDRKTIYIIIAVATALLLVVLLIQTLINPSRGLEQIEGPKIATVTATVVGDLVEGYPSAVPKWDGATVVSSDRTQQMDFDVYDLALITNDPFDVVLNGYLTGLQKEGFSMRQREISSVMTSVEASTTAHGATFVFYTDENTGQTGITASIRTFR